MKVGRARYDGCVDLGLEQMALDRIDLGRNQVKDVLFMDVECEIILPAELSAEQRLAGTILAYLDARDHPTFSTLRYDNAIIAPLSAMQLPVNKITDLYLPTP
jgi:hypothetical protein